MGSPQVDRTLNHRLGGSAPPTGVWAAAAIGELMAPYTDWPISFVRCVYRVLRWRHVFPITWPSSFSGSLFPNLRFFNNFFGSFSKNRVFCPKHVKFPKLNSPARTFRKARDLNAAAWTAEFKTTLAARLRPKPRLPL